MSDSNGLKQFDFSFDPSLDAFDASEPESMDDVGADPGVFLPNVEGRTEFLPPDADRVPVIPNAVDRLSPDYAARPAQERTRELLAHMAPHRQVLLGALRAATNPIADAAMRDAVEELRAHKFSVYSSSNICTMLEAAGALERVTEDGTPYAQYVPAPNIVVVDGEEFYEPADAPDVYWLITDAGMDALDANDPADRIARQLEREREFAMLYKRVLVLTARGEGATMAQLSGAVDSDPLICEPRRYFVQHFVEALERCECVAWQGTAWKATDLGERVLSENLADVSDTLPDSIETPEHMPTETQGVNW